MWGCSVVSNSLRPHGHLGSPPGTSVHEGFSRQEYLSGCHALLQGIFPTQGSNLDLLHCRCILYCLSHQESPRILGFTQPRVASSYDLDGTATLGACSLVGIRVENRGPLASNLLYAIPSHCPCCTDPSSRAFDDAASSRESICTCLLWQPQPFLLLT